MEWAGERMDGRTDGRTDSLMQSSGMYWLAVRLSSNALCDGIPLLPAFSTPQFRRLSIPFAKFDPILRFPASGRVRAGVV